MKNLSCIAQYLIILFGTLTFSKIFVGCNLNLPVVNEQSDPNVVRNAEDLRNLLVPAYVHLPLYQLDLSIYGNDFYPTVYASSEAKDLLLLYKWNPLVIQQEAEDYWNNAYKSIVAINNVLERKDLVRSAETYQILGEAYTLKAYIYFQLLQLFSTPYDDMQNKQGVVIRDKVTGEYGVACTKTVTVQKILRLLNKAENNFLKAKSSSPTENVLSESALLILKSNLYLYIHDYDHCIAACKAFYNFRNIGLIKSETYNQDFWLLPVFPAVVWKYKLAKSNFYQGLFGQNLIHYEWQCFLPSEKIKYGKNDKRSKSYVISTEGVFHRIMGKYNLQNYLFHKSVKYVCVFRSAEVLFNEAEAYIMNNKIKAAKSLLNDYLGYDCKLDTLLTKQENLAIFQYEKEKEFIGEGINFFDMKRWHLSKIIYGVSGEKIEISPDDYRFTWPIPKSELVSNDSLHLQNPGWTNWKRE